MASDVGKTVLNGRATLGRPTAAGRIEQAPSKQQVIRRVREFDRKLTEAQRQADQNLADIKALLRK